MFSAPPAGEVPCVLFQKAQQEKRELKEHLARARAGIAQTAAADEKEKDSRAELLRSMDPKEQERILKEVLREFLS